MKQIIREIITYTQNQSGSINDEYLKANNYQFLRQLLALPEFRQFLEEFDKDVAGYPYYTNLVNKYDQNPDDLELLNELVEGFHSITEEFFIDFKEYKFHSQLSQKLMKILQENFDIRWHYFDYIDFKNTLVKAKYGQIPLNFESFEEGASVFSLFNSNQVVSGLSTKDFEDTYGFETTNYSNTAYNYWSKQALIKAITDSGLQFGLFKATARQYTQEEIEQYYQLQTLGRGYEDKYDLSENSPELQRKQFHLNNKIPLQVFGLPPQQVNNITVDYVEGLGLTPYKPLYYYEEIYRRIHGTIYTISWDKYCMFATVENEIYNILSDDYLKIMLTIYYPNITFENKNQVCQQLTNTMGEAIMLMQSYGNNVAGWIQFLLAQYQRYEMIGVSTKRQGDSLQGPVAPGLR